MKKVLVGILAIMLILLTLGCGQTKVEDIEPIDESEDILEDNDPFSGFDVFPDFRLKDIRGDEVTEDIFSDYSLTLVNIWATTCGPCIRELPDLQELHLEMEDSQVNILGVIADGMVNSAVAKDYLDRLEISYANIVPDEKFMREFVSHTMWVPVSLLVDNSGKIIGQTISGARSKGDYLSILEDTLKALK